MLIFSVDEYSESEEEEDEFDESASETDSEGSSPRRRSPPAHKKRNMNIIRSADHKSILRRQTGDLFMTLLECVVMTLATEYPKQNE